MRKCFVLLVVAATIASPVGARRGSPQVTGASSPQQPTFRVEANYVRVDVYATKDRKPVTDLTRDDFEVVEDRVPQTIAAFEHVAIRGNVPQQQRREPSSVAESRAAIENPRARVFVLFLDTYHVGVGGSHDIRKPLVAALDGMMSGDDLVAVMTPEMSAADLAFARKTTTIDGFLARHWTWGERDQITAVDPEDERYRQCYPRHPEVAEEMIARRREIRTLDALQDLVLHLHGAREERKAIITVSDGWLLYGPNQALSRPLDDRVPGAPELIVEPRTGRLATGTADPSQALRYACDRDRINLAGVDNRETFREITEEANRSNAAFYPVDPRGLVAFDAPLGPAPPPPPGVDRARLGTRLDSLRALAADTDGTAIVNTNNLSAGLQRVVADLSSYYLLGYYSTGKLDGRFHSISVRVRRPDIHIRARRGYRAAREEDVEAGKTPSASGSAVTAVSASIAGLARFSRDAPVRLAAASGWPRGVATIWAAGEVGAGDWLGGADVDVVLTRLDGQTVATARAQMAAGTRSFRVAISSPDLGAGSYQVRARLRSRRPDAPVVTDTVDVVVREIPVVSGALVMRRGPTTGNRETPAADLRFRRTEQLGVEVPGTSEVAPRARVLDRAGNPLPLPVTTSVRDAADGRWHLAQVALAPLAPGDYVMEMGATLVAFRVVP